MIAMAIACGVLIAIICSSRHSRDVSTEAPLGAKAGSGNPAFPVCLDPRLRGGDSFEVNKSQISSIINRQTQWPWLTVSNGHHIHVILSEALCRKRHIRAVERSETEAKVSDPSAAYASRHTALRMTNRYFSMIIL
jgi:hypothetical protein